MISILWDLGISQADQADTELGFLSRARYHIFILNVKLWSSTKINAGISSSPWLSNILSISFTDRGGLSITAITITDNCPSTGCPVVVINTV